MNGAECGNGIASFPIIRIKECGKGVLLDDLVVVEHQMKVYINGNPLIDMVCSPSELRSLVLGFLYSEGYIVSLSDVEEIEIKDQGTKAFVVLKKNSQSMLHPVSELQPVVPMEWAPADLLKGLEEYFKGSDLFLKTGGVHSCILTTVKGKLLYACEDIGRHNALDKAVGMALQDGAELSGLVLYTSGRVPADMMKKMIRSRIPLVISHSAVTSQAIEMAKKYSLTLIGFARGSRCNLYSGSL